VLQAPDAEWEAIEAGYQIGIVSFLDGEYRAAQELLAGFIEQHPKDHRIGAAHFYLAEALTQLGEYAAAIEHYTLYLERQDVLADLVYERIAGNHMALGAPQAAIGAYQQALDRAPDLGQQYDLREQIGLAYSAWGHYDEAIVWLQEITELSENVYRLARVWYLIGETYRLAGMEDQALDAFARAANGDPRPGHAHLALVELIDAGVEVSEYQRGLIDYHVGSYDAAVAAFRRYIAATTNYNLEAHYYIALSYLEAGALDLAVEACQEAIERYRATTDPDTTEPDAATPVNAARWGELWLLKGQALARLEREDEAVKTYIGFADANQDHSLAPEARWRAAQLLEQAGRYQQAASVYAGLADVHPDADKAPAARFRAGISHYRKGDVDAALADWKELVDGRSAPNGPASPAESLAARYWLGKTLWTRGQSEQARLLLQTLADEHPRDYYGLRAKHLIENNGRAEQWHTASLRQLPTSLHLTSDEQAEKQETENWLRRWTDAPAQGELGTVSGELAGHLLFRRAMEMNALGLRSQARDTFEQLRRELAGDALSLYQLALATRDLDLYAPSMRATIDVIALAPEPSVLDMPRLIQRLAFPTYYSDLVLAECKTQALDPLLMFALIRQESVFDAEATSWAGAVGLTQVMPSTGEWIAEMTAWPEYSQETLQRAYLNVKFGAWFLARILEQAQGNVMAALAGYNGGPARAKGWLEQANGDSDLFVEVITRDEPQRYVRLIYRHYDMYVRLYGFEQR
jgi:soluble lytic murein transglycosylase